MHAQVRVCEHKRVAPAVVLTTLQHRSVRQTSTASEWQAHGGCRSQVIAKSQREQLRAMIMDVTSGNDSARYRNLLECVRSPGEGGTGQRASACRGLSAG